MHPAARMPMLAMHAAKSEESEPPVSIKEAKHSEFRSRRQFFTNLAAVVVAGTLYRERVPAIVSAAENRLRDLAAQKGLLYGCATSKGPLSTDPAFAQLVVDQCSLLVPEIAFNWKYTEPVLGSFDFQRSDWMAEFASAHGLKFGGGTLIWNQALPPWISTLSQANARTVMLNHVRQIVSHYRGRIFSWSVVNEAIAFREEGTELKSTPILRLVGPDYVEVAFRAAAAADPHALLVFNNNHLEYDNPSDEYGRTMTLKVLKQLVTSKVPVNALGIQSHLLTGGVPFNAGKLSDFLGRVTDLGLKILVTELDVTEKGPETSIADRDRAIADEIRRYLDVVLRHKAVIAVTTWGLAARYTWLANFAPRADGQKVRPLPYDADLRPTPAWQAIAEAFENAPRR